MFLLEEFSRIETTKDKDYYKIALKLKEGGKYKIKLNIKDTNLRQLSKLLIF